MCAGERGPLHGGQVPATGTQRHAWQSQAALDALVGGGKGAPAQLASLIHISVSDKPPWTPSLDETKAPALHASFACRATSGFAAVHAPSP